MRHTTPGGDFNSKRSFRRQRDSILGRFAVDQKADSLGRVIIRNFRPEAIAFFSDYEKKSNVNAFALQAFGGGDLRGDDALGVARSAAIDAGGILRGRNEGRDGVHVGGEDDHRVGMIRVRGINVEAVAFDGNLSGLVSDAAELAVEIVRDGGFVAGDRFDVDELTGEGDSVHGGENSKTGFGLPASGGRLGRQASGFRPQTSDLGSQASDLGTIVLPWRDVRGPTSEV